jgi:hypothetical protein
MFAVLLLPVKLFNNFDVLTVIVPLQFVSL